MPNAHTSFGQRRTTQLMFTRHQLCANGVALREGMQLLDCGRARFHARLRTNVVDAGQLLDFRGFGHIAAKALGVLVCARTKRNFLMPQPSLV